MITKDQADTIAKTHQAQLPERVDQFLRNRAALGAVGGLFRYTEFDTGPVAAATLQALRDSGWTTDIDTVNRIVTIS